MTQPAGRPWLAARVAPLMSALLMLALLVVACGSPNRAFGRSACGSLSQSRYFHRARLIMVGVMMPGPTATVFGQGILVSPARMRVTRYLKGAGPGVVTVVTRVQNGNVIKRKGIEPQAGQRWMIYTRSARMPYLTTPCQGSRLETP